VHVLLLSTYELGHQPLGLARPAADLLAAGHELRCHDLAVERLDPAHVAWADLIGISAPMHTATRLGARLARLLRELNAHAHLTFYGLYASLHADVLVPDLADSAIGGEFEAPLVALADGLRRVGRTHADLAPIPGVRTAFHDGGVDLGRQTFRLPRRDLLPPLERYAHVDLGAEQRPVGYVEASRGCAHRCLHCPITPVYGGRLRVVQQDVVLQDIEQLIRMGARHITFGDPDFFNGIRHSLRIVEELHAAYPSVTYDATIKVEHLLEHGHQLATLARTGCLFIVSAVESIDDRVLTYLAKGHTAADVDTALDLTRGAGIPVRPTFLPFTPWLDLDGYRRLLAWVRRCDLIGNVDPVQYAIRMLVPRGSSLYGTSALAPHVGPFDGETFSYRWTHPDPRMDALQLQVAAAVEDAASGGGSPAQTLARVECLAATMAGDASAGGGIPDSAGVVLPSAAFVPRLTEAWFC
jgi:radical SAM superfamily enzyme YgiQ (UPF0313 family)